MTIPPLLRVLDLEVHYPLREGLFRRKVGVKKAVDGLTFQLLPGESLALVGEAGSGKTTLGRTILGLEAHTGGQLFFDGKELRGKRHTPGIQMLFPDIYMALNPRLTLEQSLREPLQAGLGLKGVEVESRLAKSLALVQLNRYLLQRRPQELTGLMRFKIALARILATEPKLLLIDTTLQPLEPTVQPQAIALLRDVQRKTGLALLMLSESLHFLDQLADRIGVLYQGRLLELAGTQVILERPLHPLTQVFLSQLPHVDPEIEAERIKNRLEEPAGGFPTLPLRNVGTPQEPHLVALP